MTGKYLVLAQRMTRKEMIVFQLQRQAQEAIDQAYYDGMKKMEAMWATPAAAMTDTD